MSNDLFDLIAGTIAHDKQVSTSDIEKAASEKLTFKRDEKGILWSYDAKTGEKVGRIFEHGESDTVTIKEV